MDDNQIQTETTVRPTKKQKELLAHIEQFIAENGYSPSYREIMTALNYNSVATVALHIGNLIKRGHLRKRDHSARSLEVVHLEHTDVPIVSNHIKATDEKWLVGQVEYYIKQLELEGNYNESGIQDVAILLAALRVLGLDGAAQSFGPRYTNLKQKQAVK